MRLGWVVVCLGVFGCASQRGATAVEAEREIAAGRFDRGALLLREALAETPASENSLREQHRLIIRLAHAQLCTSAMVGEPELAHATHGMLQDYEAEHVRSEDETAQRKLRRAKREATLAAEQPRVWASGRCRKFGRRRMDSRYVGSLELAFSRNVPAPVFRRPVRFAVP